jgi:hypothetical protein
MSLSLQERASRYVARMDAAVSGSGGHDATFAVAVALVHGFALGESEAMSLMQEYNSRCAPPWSDRDLAYKLRSAANSRSPRGSGYLIEDSKRPENYPSPYQAITPQEKVAFDPDALALMAGDFRPRLDWFANRSYADPSLMSSADFLGLLYAGEKVLIFVDDKSQGQALWPDEPIPANGNRGMWYLSNPVDGKEYPNPRTGKMSRRSEESVTKWKFALLESDEADPRIWLGALAKSTLPIAAIYSSGGRSVHALVRVPGQGGPMAALSGPSSKMEWDEWARAQKPNLSRMGADPKALTAVRLTRLPQKWRPEKGSLQKLIYVCPTPFGERILDRAPSRDVLRDAVEASKAAIASENVESMESAAERLQFYIAMNPKFPAMVDELRRDAQVIRDLHHG